MTKKKDDTCQHHDETNTVRDCDEPATWEFPIVQVPTLACDEHLPAYAAKTAQRV